MEKRLFLCLLGLAFVADMYFIFQGESLLRFYTKPLLMPFLMLYYLTSSISGKIDFFLYAGLLMSFFGDFFLLFHWGFVPGLISFLLAHVAYIYCFKRKSAGRLSVMATIGIGLYALVMIVLLYPYLGTMQIPVMVYTVVISTMLYWGIAARQWWIGIGAMLFVISDTVLSVHLFVRPSVWSEMLVMLLYVSAQVAIVFGVKQWNARAAT
ncbi:MAG: lysoplasmalogenase [Capnocytophaga sp.]|nr:lysoplasmalogenase [Capnocytophaga sp.]